VRLRLTTDRRDEDAARIRGHRLLREGQARDVLGLAGAVVAEETITEIALCRRC